MLVNVDGKQYNVPNSIVDQIKTGKWDSALKAIRTTYKISEELARAIAKEVKDITLKEFVEKKEREEAALAEAKRIQMQKELEVLKRKMKLSAQETSQKREMLKDRGYEKAYEYKVLSLVDGMGGRCNIETMENVLNNWALDGWKVKAIVGNELGKNALAVMGVGINSTVDEMIIILEREYTL